MPTATVLIVAILGGLLAAVSTPFAAPERVAADSPPPTVAPSTIGLTSSGATFATGSPVTLTATTDVDVAPTSSVIRIIDLTTTTTLATCTSGSVCTAAASFLTGPAHSYQAFVSTLNSNVVVVARQAWAVTLTSDKTTFAAGETVSLTATTNQTLPAYQTNNQYFLLRIYDETTGQPVVYCYSSPCTARVSFYTGGPHTYVAEVAGPSPTYPTYGTATDVQAISNEVVAARQAWAVTLTGDTTRVANSSPVVLQVALTATANQDVGLTNSSYVINIVDFTAGAIISTCQSGTICQTSVQRLATTAAHSYIAYVAPRNATVFTPAAGLQASSNGFSADTGHGAVLAGESNGGSNASEKNCQCAHADPVNTATGEFYLPATDIGLPGVGPGLSIGRTYSTNNAGVTGPFGYGWSTNFTSSLAVLTPGNAADPSPRQVQITQENGATVVFSENADQTYSAPARVLATLNRDATTGQWTFTRSFRQVVLFDSSGRLTAIKDLNGNTVTLGYDASNQVVTMTASGGRVLTLTWTTGRVTKVTDSAGRAASYRYDASGNLIGITSVNGLLSAYGYNAAHFMTSITKPGGGVTTNAFDISNRLISQTDPIGRVTQFAYNAFTTTITDPAGNQIAETYNNGQLVSQTRSAGTSIAATTTYIYDAASNVASVTDPLGHVTSYTYDSTGNMLTSVDPLGHTTTFTYDSLGDVLTVTDALGNVSQASFDTHGNRVSTTTPAGRTQTAAVNSNGTVATATDALGHVTSFTYNPAGNIVNTTDPDGRARSVGYNSAGFVIQITDSAGKSTSSTVDAAGRVLTTTNPNGGVTKFTYDVDSNPTSSTDPLLFKTSATFDKAGQKLTQTDARGKVTKFAYTASGLLATVTDANNHVTTSTYDALNELISTKDPLARTTTITYDAAGRKTAVTSPSGAKTVTAYDAAGRITSTTDALNNVTTYGYDANNRQVSVTDPLGRITRVTYTADGQTNVVTLPNLSTQSYTYNAVGQATGFTNADGAITTYSYDAAGLLTSKTEPGGMTSGYTFDAAARIQTTTLPDASTVTYGYDSAGQLLTRHSSVPASVDVTFGYDADGRRTSMVDSTGSSSYVYNQTSQLTSETNGAGRTIAYSFDNVGQLLTMTYPGSHVVTYAYDTAGQLTSLKDWAAHTTAFAWTADGQLSAQTDPNTVKQTRTYDLDGRTTVIATTAGSTTLANFGYSYDAASQLTGDTTSGTAIAANTHAYGHDSLTQLSTVGTTVSGTTTNAAYAATSAGLLTHNTAGATLAYNAAQELTSVMPTTGPATSLTYNGLGARTTSTVAAYGSVPAATTSYAYDSLGRLAGVTLPTSTVAYSSDGNGLRQTRTTSAGTTAFLWSNAGSIPLLLDDGTNSFLYGPSTAPIAQINDTTGVIQYLQSDLLGSTRLISSSTGTIQGTTSYSPYGERLTHTGTADSTIGYTGNYTDPTTSLVYLRARDYDPRTGQFLTVDPALDKTHQPYAYVANNPLRRTDPLGLDSIIADWANGAFHVVLPGLCIKRCFWLDAPGVSLVGKVP